MKKLENWQLASTEAGTDSKPVVLMVDQSDCPFCRRVEREYFAAIFAGGEFNDQAIFAKVSIDSGETIVDETGKAIPTRQFLSPYDAQLTPTILFLDSNKNELVEKMVGLSTPDYYGYYLEKAIKQSISLAKTA